MKPTVIQHRGPPLRFHVGDVAVFVKNGPPTFMGIDNGISGAVGVIAPDGITVVPTPVVKVGTSTRIDECGLAELIKLHPETFVTLEQGQKQPKFGCKGNFANGFNDGTIQTVLRLLKVPHRVVDPKMWQTDVFKGIRGLRTTTKGASIEFCRRMFPDISLYRTPRCRTIDDNLADALCLAWWGKNFGFGTAKGK